jgi:hypothetical protein
MLSVAEGRLRDLNPAATLQVHGQELNARTYTICRSDIFLFLTYSGGGAIWRARPAGLRRVRSGP